jgi:hypothetical protein
MHNTEQHTLNGNIDVPMDASLTLIAYTGHLRELFWDAPTIQALNNGTVEALAADARTHMPQLY